jgi:hypothetical protein
VVFTAHMRVAEAWRIPPETVNAVAAFNHHVNGLKLGLTAKLKARPEVRPDPLHDVLIAGAATAAELGALARILWAARVERELR